MFFKYLAHLHAYGALQKHFLWILSKFPNANSILNIVLNFICQLDHLRSIMNSDLHLIHRLLHDISSCSIIFRWPRAPWKWNYLIRVHVLSSHIYTVHLYPVVSNSIFESFVCEDRRLLYPIPSTRYYNHLWPKSDYNVEDISDEDSYLEGFWLESSDTTIWNPVRW